MLVGKWFSSYYLNPCYKNAQLLKAGAAIICWSLKDTVKDISWIWCPSLCCIFERLLRIMVYPSNIYPDTIAQPACTIYESVVMFELPPLIIHIIRISLLTLFPQGHTTSVMHNTFMTSGAAMRLYTSIPLCHVYISNVSFCKSRMHVAQHGNLQTCRLKGWFISGFCLTSNYYTL